jgi:hypothetical protein
VHFIRHSAQGTRPLLFEDILKFPSLIAVAGAMLLLFASASSRAAELVMFEQAGCEWCAAFDRDIAPVYPKTDEGRRAPLRRVDIAQPLPGFGFYRR